MSLENDIEVLRSVQLFDDLSVEQLRLLAFGSEHRHLRAGETLFRAEARADAGFIVVSGEVELITGSGERRRVAARLGPGAILGELALLTGTRRAATAVTLSDCDLIRITRQSFRRMLEAYPEVAANLYHRMRAELAEMTAQIGTVAPRFDD